MIKRLSIGSMIVLGVIVVLFKGLSANVEGNEKFILPSYKSGDAKLAGDYIVTSKGTMQIINTKTGLIQDTGMPSNWVDCLVEDDRIVIIYGNFNKEVGICILDMEGNLVEQRQVLVTENLHIDPSIFKVNDSYYITLTEIQGNINNADSNMTNGKYTVKLFKSNNLMEWDYVSDIVSCENNLEDVELNYYDDQFYFTYEKEIIDKGLSSICIKSSTDKGLTWTEEKELIPAVADQEPAAFIKEQDRYILYYSSDKDNIGMSYAASKLYYAVFDSSFNIITKDVEIWTETNRGMLLYDVLEKDNKLHMLYAIDYLADNTLVLEKINLNILLNQ